MAGRSLGLINPALYKLAGQHAPGIVPVTSGNNSVSFRQGGRTHQVRGYGAGSGYSLAAGLGTVNAAAFVPELARLAGCRRALAAGSPVQPRTASPPCGNCLGNLHTLMCRLPHSYAGRTPGYRSASRRSRALRPLGKTPRRHSGASTIGIFRRDFYSELQGQ